MTMQVLIVHLYCLVQGSWHSVFGAAICPGHKESCKVACAVQDDQRLTHDCCQAAEALHSASVVMRDFRLPNIVTRNGVEGDSVVIKLESAEPDKHLWLIEPLQDWDDQTLNQVQPASSNICGVVTALCNACSAKMLSIASQEF